MGFWQRIRGRGLLAARVLLKPTVASGGKAFTSFPELYVDIAVATVTVDYGSVYS